MRKRPPFLCGDGIRRFHAKKRIASSKAIKDSISVTEIKKPTVTVKGSKGFARRTFLCGYGKTDCAFAQPVFVLILAILYAARIPHDRQIKLCRLFSVGSVEILELEKMLISCHSCLLVLLKENVCSILELSDKSVVTSFVHDEVSVYACRSF